MLCIYGVHNADCVYEFVEFSKLKENWFLQLEFHLSACCPFSLICLFFCFSSILSTCNKTRECRDQTYQISCHPLVFGRKETGKRLRRCLIAIQSSMFIECICTTISSRRLCGCRPSRARKTAVFHWPAKSSIVTNDYCLEMCRTMCVLYSFFAHILYTNGPSFTDAYTTAMTTSRWSFHCHTIKI